MLHWLKRIGYQSFYSGIGFNDECPNLLIQRRINQTIDKAIQKAGPKVHLIGHSLGGIMARSVAAQRSDDIASVITLGAPMRGLVAHPSVLRAAEKVRLRIINEHSTGVLPHCYTTRCTCDFANAARASVADTVLETAIYTQDDGIVDWRYCKTDEPSADFAVHSTHIGMVFNPAVYRIIADRLAIA
jgi:Predicted acetyltransferases and hydrolases with the alpha/beta hydrolase fold